MFRFFYNFFKNIILIYVLVLGYTMFTLFVPYLICICNVIWQLNALNGFSFQLLIYAISAIKNKKKSKKETNYLFILRDLSYLSCIFRIAL